MIRSIVAAVVLVGCVETSPGKPAIADAWDFENAQLACVKEHDTKLAIDACRDQARGAFCEKFGENADSRCRMTLPAKDAGADK